MKRGHKKGDIQRTVRCNFCGGEHRRQSRELRECREKYRRGRGGGDRPRDPTTLKQPKPDYEALGGNPRYHLIIRWAKKGLTAKQVAAKLGLPRDQVKEAFRRAGLS